MIIFIMLLSCFIIFSAREWQFGRCNIISSIMKTDPLKKSIKFLRHDVSITSNIFHKIKYTS